MVSAGSYLLSAAAARGPRRSRSASAPIRLRQRLLPGWDGAPARLVESIVGIALLIWLSELLGTFELALRLDPVASALLPLLAGGPVGWAVRLRRRVASLRGTTAEDASGDRRGGGSPAATGPAGQSALSLLVMVGVIAARGRPLGADDQVRAGPRHLQLRLPLVPHAVRRGHGPEPLGDRPAPHRDGLHQLVLPAELRAPARGRDPAHRARHALALPQLRLAGARLPRRLVHRPALRARPPHRRRRGDPARVPHAGRPRARGGEERPRRRGPAARRDRDPDQRLGVSGGRGRTERTPAGGLGAGGGRARRRAGRRDQVDGAGDGGGADRGRDRPGAAGQALGGRGLVVRAGPRSAAASGTCAT